MFDGIAGGQMCVHSCLRARVQSAHALLIQPPVERRLSSFVFLPHGPFYPQI